MIDLALLAGIIGAITGIVSLGWHIINSKSKLILEKVFFTKADRHTHKIVIDTEIVIRNKGNRSTTIEEVYFEFGNHIINVGLDPMKIDSNSSSKIKFSRGVKLEEFNEFMKEKKIKLGIDIIHTFGRIKKQGHTNFSTPWLSL